MRYISSLTELSRLTQSVYEASIQRNSNDSKIFMSSNNSLKRAKFEIVQIVAWDSGIDEWLGHLQ